MKWLNTLEINKLLRHFSLSLDIKVEKDVAYSGMIFTCALLFIPVRNNQVQMSKKNNRRINGEGTEGTEGEPITDDGHFG